MVAAELPSGARQAVAAKQSAAEGAKLAQLSAGCRLASHARVPRDIERHRLVGGGSDERARVGRQRRVVGLVLAETEPVMTAVIAAEELAAGRGWTDGTQEQTDRYDDVARTSLKVHGAAPFGHARERDLRSANALTPSPPVTTDCPRQACAPRMPAPISIYIVVTDALSVSERVGAEFCREPALTASHPAGTSAGRAQSRHRHSGLQRSRVAPGAGASRVRGDGTAPVPGSRARRQRRQ